MRHLLACTCLTPVLLAATGNPAFADRTVSTATTAPIATSTATSGGPDNVVVTSAGSIKLTGGTAITVDSNNSVSNAGTIEILNASDATGILAQPGRTGNITNSGTIRLTEDYTPTDADKDGDIDGPFAQGARRYGIRIAPGGSFTGNVINSNRIEIEGNESAAIALDSRLVGALTNSGAIDVLGNNSFGIRASDVTGNVTINGGVSARGQNSVGVALDGDIGGALVFQGLVSATGYRSTTPPADASKLDADDLLQGGPAVRISGDVARGIVFAAPPPNNSTTDDDEDDDGVKDAEEGTATIQSAGAAPAVLIGSATDNITVGAITGNTSGHGLLIEGSVTGAGVYAGINGNGVQIGGLGGNVTIAGGMTVSGTVTASSNGANATGIRIGSGASVPAIRVSGTVRAQGGGDAGDLSRAIQVDAGSTVTTIRNSGKIEASAGANGSAAAIVDLSGGVTLVENQNLIAAAGGLATQRVAIDLGANTSGATVRQTRLAGTNTPVPAITGDIRFGSGNDLLEVADGTVTGTASFGAGADRMALSGGALFSGAADFGTGSNRLEIGGTARFVGTLTNSTGLDVAMSGGTFHVTQTGGVALNSLSVGNGATLGVDIDGAAGTHTRYDVAGAASFGTGTEIRVRLRNVSEAAGRYVVVDAGSLTSAGAIGFDSDTLPFLFRGTVETNAAAGEVAVNIARKTATELGLNGSASSAYDAVFDALDSDSKVAGVFLGIADGETLRSQLTQLLPDHAGGTFGTVTLGSRATARFLNDPRPVGAEMGGGWRFWIQQAGFGTSKDLGDTASYDVSGWAASGGLERELGAGAIGGTLAYITGSDANGDNDNSVRSEQFELAAYWRGTFGPFHAYARGSAASVSFDSTRIFTGTTQDGEAVTRTTSGEWNGTLFSAGAGLSYDLDLGALHLRPSLALDYYRLSEDGYEESGGGDAIDLIVDGRDSDELAGTAALAVGMEWGNRSADQFWLRAEAEGGRRQILAGALGETVARFGDGDDFTLEPEERMSGWTGAVRLVGGQGGTVVGAELLAEEQDGRASIGGRISLRIAF
ncbi:MAG: autotransporter domain-containing protein [Allosphingosinicella sp.]|uniref:autotransporter outer membrane beta-barrel domain-containing protein n=1 Tax=Allosphingosinicella sp. TaxID=2823234 RepID=UPI00395B86E5